MAVVTIVGAGMMGTALAFPASENNKVSWSERRWTGSLKSAGAGRNPKLQVPSRSSTIKSSGSGGSAGADMVIGGVNSFGVTGSENMFCPKFHLIYQFSVLRRDSTIPRTESYSHIRKFGKAGLKKQGSIVRLTQSEGPAQVMSWWHTTRQKLFFAGKTSKCWKKCEKSWQRTIIISACRLMSEG